MVLSAVTGTDGKVWTETPGSLCFGPVTMQFTDASLRTPEGVVGVPPDSSEIEFVVPWGTGKSAPEFPFGTQCAFLQGDGAMSREFAVEKAGAYWITLNTAMDRTSNGYRKEGWGGWTVARGANTIRVRVDGRELSIGVDELKIKGVHNIYNAMAASIAW